MGEVVFMNKKFLSLFLILFLNIVSTPALFAMSNTELLSKIENSIFGYENTDKDVVSRLNLIEENVYGSASKSKNVDERLAKLNKDLGAEMYGQEIEPCEDTLAQEEEQQEVLSSQAPNIDYPVINELEKSVFNKEYKNLGVKDRLAQLENKLFSTNYANEDLSTRVDRLRDRVRPQALEPKLANDDYNISGYYPPMTNYDGMSLGGSSMSYDADYYTNSVPQFQSSRVNLASVEKSLYNKNFKNDTMPNRLARVEQSMFGQSFDDQDEATRIQRIASVYNAQKSASKYDSNKFTQNMATAMQIGTMILMILACIL